MPTLHNTTETIKTVGKGGGTVIGSILLIFLIFRGGKALFSIIFPKKPPAPNVAFGKLPPLLYPENTIDKQLTYSLETVTGGLPTIETDRLTVFRIIPKEPQLLDLDDTRKSVAAVDFTTGENKITDTVYQWTNNKRSDKKIIRNIVSQDFTLNSNFFSYPDVLNASELPTEEQAKEAAKLFLTSMAIFPSDIDTDKTTTQLLAIQNATIFPATSLSTAQLIRVDFFQKSVNKLPIYYPRPPFSTMHFFVGGGESRGQIVQGQFYHQNISDKSASYPIKTPQEAFEELQRGKGYIAAYYGSNTTVTLTNIYPAYYMGEEKQEYLIPIYVFEGKDGFFGYVTAITNEWIIGNESNQQPSGE